MMEKTLSTDSTDLKAGILAEIRVGGPMTFARYMELCLYHPRLGYYTSGKNRFGKSGDYYTSAQVGPLFARLLARRFEQMRRELGAGEFTVLEMGPGRGDFGRELQAVAPHLRYIPVEYGESFPNAPFTGCVFSNEFFDALPVHSIRNGHEMLVGERGGELAWVEGPPSDHPGPEFCPDAERWMRSFAAVLQRGYVLAVDYGYRGREGERFPEGTLMSYRRHTASEDVLADPGERDITAHVDFDLLARTASEAGLRETCFEPQSRYLMRLGEEDQFASVLAGSGSEAERTQAALQLKNLLFGIGETMRVLEMRKEL